MTNKPSIEQIITIIGNGHAYDEHVLGNDPDPAQQKYKGQNQFRTTGLGPDLNINTKADLTNYMKGFLDKPGTIGFQHPDGRYLFYNRADNVVMVMNGKSGDMGTVFRPDAGKAYFEKELKNAQNQAARAGSKVVYETTPEGIKSLSNRAERTFMHDTRAMRTIEERSKDLGIDHTLGRKPPSAPSTPGPPEGPSSGSSGGSSTSSSPSALSIADKEIAESIMDAKNSEAFFDAKTGSKFFLSEDKKTMMMLDSSGAMRLYKDNADKAFMLAFEHVAETNGKMPDIIKGGMKALTESAEKGGLAARFLGKYADDATGIAKLAGKLSKVLPVVGAVAVAVETYQFLHKAGDAQRMGLISGEALNEYRALCTGSGATGLGGFITSTGGEVAAMAAFDLWATKHNVPDYLRKELQPDGLVRMAKDAAEKYILPGADTKASLELKMDGNNDAIISASKKDDFDLEPTNYEAAVCYIPEIEMLVENTKMVKQAEREFTQSSAFLGNISNASLKMSLAEERLADSIKELADNGGLKEVIDFSNDAYKQAVTKPDETKPAPQQDSLLKNDERFTLAIATSGSKGFSP